MNGNKLNEMERLKLIERGIDPDTGGKLNGSKNHPRVMETGQEVVINSDVYCTRWGSKVPIQRIFSGQS